MTYAYGQFFARLRGSDGESFAQKFSQVAQFFTKQAKRNAGHMMGKHRPTYEVHLFLHMNLSYEFMKHVKRNSCLFHFDGQRYLWCDLCHCCLQSWHIPNKCDVKVFNLYDPLNDRSAEYMLKWTLINARLEIPYVNNVAQCNTVPNQNTIANMYMYRDMSPFKITRNSSRARRPLSRVNLTGITMLNSV